MNNDSGGNMYDTWSKTSRKKKRNKTIMNVSFRGSTLAIYGRIESNNEEINSCGRKTEVSTKPLLTLMNSRQILFLCSNKK